MEKDQFSCYVCGKDCKTRGGLKTHLQAKHPNIKKRKQNADIRELFGWKPRSSIQAKPKNKPPAIELKEIKRHQPIPKPETKKFDPTALKLPTGRIPRGVGPRDPRRREEHRRHYFACEQKYGIEVVGKKIYAEQNGLIYDVF